PPPPLRWDRGPVGAGDLRRRSRCMQIEFGWCLDGASWADAASGGAAGRLRVGPRGLLGILQTRLALSRPAVDQAVRIAQYLRLVEQCVQSPADREGFWPARSFALDPWSTASAAAAGTPPWRRA